RDWSSDVCSSDLVLAQRVGGDSAARHPQAFASREFLDGELFRRPLKDLVGGEQDAFRPGNDVIFVQVRNQAAWAGTEEEDTSAFGGNGNAMWQACTETVGRRELFEEG